MPTVLQIAGTVFRTVIQVVIMDSLYLTTGIIWIYLGNIWTKTGTKGELRTTSSFNDQFLVFYCRKRPVSRTKLSHFDKSFWLKNHSSVNEVGMTVHIDRPLSFKPTGWKTYVKVPTWSGPWIPDWRVDQISIMHYSVFDILWMTYRKKYTKCIFQTGLIDKIFLWIHLFDFVCVMTFLKQRLEFWKFFFNWRWHGCW